MLKIRNPKASFSYIKVRPGQDFVIHFPSIEGAKPSEQIIDFDWYGEFLELKDEGLLGDIDGPINIMFCQKSPDIMVEWAKYSSVVLGEVKIIRANSCSNLVVLLDQTTPKIGNIVTIINPDDITLTLRPRQILEIVLPGKHNYCQYCSTGLSAAQCFYHKIGDVLVDKEPVLADVDEFTIPIYPKVDELARHLFYKPVLGGVNWPAGSYNAGRIFCEDAECPSIQGRIDLNLKLRRKDTKKMGSIIPPKPQNIVPHCKKVALEEVDGEFEGCEQIEFIGEDKVVTTADNQVIVYPNYKYLIKPNANN
jgi:hypothetical protein